jgi:uracil-DNA glycosylase family 4
MSGSSKSEALVALRWLLDAGADEAVGEVPINRFAARESRAGFEAGAPTARSAEPDKREVPKQASSPEPPSRPRAAFEAGSDSIGQAMEMAARCMSLPDLKAALERFEGSQLKKNATNMVFSDGNPESRVMFIGEAPGREEDRLGLPFVGRAGKLLDRMLASIGLDRTAAYIINVLPWRPPDNRNPEATEVAQCIPFLRRHIELAQPEIMILLGAVAVRHVLGLAEGVMKYRGRWMEYRVGEKMIPVMPTLHPAYLLRQPAHKRLAWRDLQAVDDKISTLVTAGQLHRSRK